MRKMFSFMIISADGYHADPGQALDWQTIDEEFSLFALAQLRGAGTRVFGLLTYELMAGALTRDFRAGDAPPGMRR